MRKKPASDGYDGKYLGETQLPICSQPQMSGFTLSQVRSESANCEDRLDDLYGLSALCENQTIWSYSPNVHRREIGAKPGSFFVAHTDVGKLSFIGQGPLEPGSKTWSTAMP